MDNQTICDALAWAYAYAHYESQALDGSVFGEKWDCAKRALEEAIKIIKAQEQRKRIEVHNIGNVDIPEGVTWEQFQAVMTNVVKALEHTDKGESWPYEEDNKHEEG